MEQVFINRDFIVVNQHDTRFYVVKKHPYARFDINEDSFKILEFIHTNEGLLEEEEPLAEHIANFINQLLEYGILTRDPHQRGDGNVKKKVITPECHRIFFEITPQCNLKCQHCYNSSHPTTGIADQITTDEVKRLIDEAHAMGIWQFDLTGGEIFLRDDIFEVLAYLERMGMHVKLFSNLTLLNQEKIQRLKSLNIRKIITSLDAYTPERHDSFRGQPGAWQKTVDNIKALRDQGIDVNVNITIGDHNADEIDRLVDFLRFELKVSYVADVILPLGRGNVITTAENYARCLGYVNSLRTQETPCSMQNMGEFEVARQAYCGVGEDFLYVTYEGSFNLCTSMHYRVSEEFRFGNIRTDSLAEVWTRRMDKYRQIHCSEAESCVAKEKCRGGCRSRAYSVYGSLYAPDKVYCKMHGVGDEHAKQARIS